MVYIGAIALTVLIFGLLIVLAGGEPVKAYRTMLEVSVGNAVGFAQTLKRWTPLLIGGLAVTIASRASVWNIGVDGQIYLGAIFATGLGLLLVPCSFPRSSLWVLLLAAGMIGGGLYAALAGLLKTRYGVNEIFVTVMLNFIALYLTSISPPGSGMIQEQERPFHCPSQRAYFSPS